MASPDLVDLSSEAPDENLGLLANGASGPWEFSVDETISGTERWFAQIEGPSVYISFEIPSPSIVGEALRFLSSSRAEERDRNAPAREIAELLVSKVPGMPISLMRDDEYEDRRFIMVGHRDSPLVRFTLAGDDLENLVEAMRQANQDIGPS